MDLSDAVVEANRWLRHLDRQRERAREWQAIARMARAGREEEAQKMKRRMDSSPVVYDGAKLEIAVKTMIKALAGGEE